MPLPPVLFVFAETTSSSTHRARHSTVALQWLVLRHLLVCRRHTLVLCILHDVHAVDVLCLCPAGVPGLDSFFGLVIGEPGLLAISMVIVSRSCCGECKVSGVRGEC